MGCGCCALKEHGIGLKEEPSTAGSDPSTSDPNEAQHLSLSPKAALTSGLSGAVASMAGVHNRVKRYTGKVTIRNELQTEASLQFVETKLLGKHILFETVKPDTQYIFDPGENKQFDFLLLVDGGAARANILRCCEYKLILDEVGKISVEIKSPPKREESKKLADVRGLSVSLSASGWLVVYQLGAAECLKNHGIVENPYVRVSGASGGALTAAILMYDGADPNAVKDILLDCARKVHSDLRQNLSLREFLLLAMKSIVKDGSFQHPAFLSKRVEIVVSSSSSKMPGFFEKILLTGSEHRCKDFKSSTDIAIALLASSTCGISGLPFTMEDENGKKSVVADGALKNFLPKIDEHSITVKPLCDGVGFAARGFLSGDRADVGPTEFVSSTFGAFPPPVTMLEHLYELGYQDMQAWIDNKLDDRLDAIKATQKDQTIQSLPPTSWKCENEGMLWYDDLRAKVPVSWVAMLSHSFYCDERPFTKPLHEGVLKLEKLQYYGQGEAGEPVLENEIPIPYNNFRVKLTKVDLQWGPEDQKGVPAGMSPEQQEEMMRGLLASGFFGAEQATVLDRAKNGRLHLTWICSVSLDELISEALHVATANYRVTLKATSAADAQKWHEVIQAALSTIRSMLEDPEES